MNAKRNRKREDWVRMLKKIFKNDMDGYGHEVDVRMSFKGAVNGVTSIHR